MSPTRDPAQRDFPGVWHRRGGPPGSVRWAAANPVLFGVLMGIVTGAVAFGALLWFADWTVAIAGIAIGGVAGSMASREQRSISEMIDRWDAEHGA